MGKELNIQSTLIIIIMIRNSIDFYKKYKFLRNSSCIFNIIIFFNQLLMGGGQSAPKVTKYSAMTADIVNSNIVEFDKIFLLLDDIIAAGEAIRYNTMSARELMLRITKVNVYKNPTVLDAFRIWVQVVGACNDGSLENVKFKAAWKDYNDTSLKEDIQEAVEDVKGALSKGFGGLMALGKKAVKKIEKKVEEAVDAVMGNEEEEKPLTTAMGEYGKCGDVKLQLFPTLMATFIEGVRNAKTSFAMIVDELTMQVEKIKAMKNDVAKFKEMAGGYSLGEQIKIGLTIAGDIAQCGVALEVAKNFEKLIPEYVAEVEAFLAGYEEVLKNSGEDVQRVYEQIGVQPYYDDENVVVLKQKIDRVTFNYFKDKEKLSEEEKKADLDAYKIDRQNRKPKKDPKSLKDDIQADENQFPSAYRWTGCKFYDTHFSAISIGFAELEKARADIIKSKKEMYKLTNVKKCKEKGVHIAFEPFIWLAASSKDGKLKELEMKLTEEPPYWTGKELEKVKFDADECEEFRKHFQCWLNYMNPKVYKRLDTYFYNSLERMEILYKNRLKFFEHFASLNPPDQYNALTSFTKNLLCNKIYKDRAEILWNDILVVHWGYYQKLSEKWEETLTYADEQAEKVKGTKLKDIFVKFDEERLNDEETYKESQKTRKEEKLAKRKRRWLWNR